jgi:hypothetical protein
MDRARESEISLSAKIAASDIRVLVREDEVHRDTRKEPSATCMNIR